MSKIEPGQVVRLKSGGPKMTVSHKDSADVSWCFFFTSEAECLNAKFPDVCLVSLETEENISVEMLEAGRAAWLQAGKLLPVGSFEIMTKVYEAMKNKERLRG